MDYHDTAPSVEPMNDDLTQSYQEDDIRVEYHPHSGHGPKILKLNEYRQPASDASAAAEHEPWMPFRTRYDFEFAEIALGSGMTRKQMDAMIKLFRRCLEEGKGSFTIKDHKDLKSTFKIAASRLTKV